MIKNEVFYKTENEILSPLQGEDISCWPTGGYASLTPGYSLITRSGVFRMDPYRIG